MDINSFIIGAAIAGVAFFFTGFLRKAGEDVYAWIRNWFLPRKLEKSTESPAQVIVQVQSVSAAELQSTNLSPVSVERVHNITYPELRADISAAPPMQREDIAKHYIGLRVQWEALFYSGKRKDDGGFSIYLTIPGVVGGIVTCEVSAEDYPELRILREGNPLRVSGDISIIDNISIALTNVRLEILEGTQTP